MLISTQLKTCSPMLTGIECTMVVRPYMVECFLLLINLRDRSQLSTFPQ